jgi:Reverse transcriptase (RNA-dependent DNA polymerase)
LFTLDEGTLQIGFDTIEHHGYSDFFPEPPEWKIVKAGWVELRALLAKMDLQKYKPFLPIYAFAPKSKINLRPVTLLHPVDLILYTSLVSALIEDIEDRRVPEYENRVFSFRSESLPSALYASVPSHAQFEAEKRDRAKKQGDGYMGFADITDFYSRLYQHKVRGALDACTVDSPKLQAHPQIIEQLLRNLTHDGLSYGIPIGPAASRPLAEAALIDIDDALLEIGADFIRYIDDFVIFASSREKVEWALRSLGGLLDKRQGLSLHAAKTKVLRCSTFLKDSGGNESTEDSVEARFAQLIEDHFYDDADGRLLDELSEDEKEALDAVDLEAVLSEALDEDEINYKKVAFILERLSSLNRADLIDIVLQHLPRLYPVAHAVHAFFRNIEPIEASVRKECAKQLLSPIRASGDAQAPEFYMIWILDLFGRDPEWNQAIDLGNVFRTTSSQAVRRYAALALSASGNRSQALSFKEAFQFSEPLTRLALLKGSRKLGADERKYWLKRTSLDWFEEFILRNQRHNGGAKRE